jgi:hypothetical protein
VRGIRVPDTPPPRGLPSATSEPTRKQIVLPTGLSGWEAAIAATRHLSERFGAVVETFDVGPDGGSITLKIPIVSEDEGVEDLAGPS